MVVYRKEPNNLDPLSGTTAAQSVDETTNDAGKSAPIITHMVSRAILTCRPNSHPFQERHLALDQPIKVGRSVARCRPAPSNAIFDCKVLSRNHALLWYENGKFFLQDTKSSNGTFVNNQRLSKSSEESAPREVCSGDIVQFGVDVVENSRKVVHGCIVATLKLYLPDGKEAKASPTTAVVPLSPETSVTSQELYTLSQYLQEALHREQVLENKLGTLQRVVANTQDETEFGWKALIEEDRLLSRIETLESQLQTCGKNATDEKLKDEVLKLQEDKDKYQTAAKDSLKNALQEKLEALRKLQDLENSLSNAANECVHLFEDNEKKEQEIKLLLEKTTENEKEISNLTKKLQEVEEKYQDLQSQNAEDKLALENNAELMRKEEQMLCTKIEELKAETDFAKEQLNAMKAHFDILKRDQSIEGNIETNGNISSHDELKISTTGGNSETLVAILRSELNRLEHELKRVQKENIKNDSYINSETDSCTTNGESKPAVYTNNFQPDIQPSKRLFEENRESKNQVDNELQQTKNQLEDVRKNVFSVTRELQFVLNQLSKAKEEVSEKSKLIKDLENRFISLSTENDPTKQKELIKETLDELKYPTISNKLKESEEPDSSTRLSSINDNNSELISDYDDLKSECAMYKKKVESLQCDLYRVMYDSTKTGDTRIENANSEVEYRRGSLGKQDSDPSDDLTFNTESEMTENARKLLHAQEEIILVKERYDECNKEKSYLQCELSALKEQIQLLSVQAKTVSVCSFIPLIVLCVAMMLAFYPTLAHLTATSDQM